MQHSINGKVIAVTGGAQGIGREIAGLLASRGATVAIGDRDIATALATAEELAGQVSAYPLDVTDEQSFTAFLAEVSNSLGPIDVFINNAGVMWVGPFDTEPEGATEKMLAVNLQGVIRGVRLVAPAMRARGRGHIITIASAASRLAPPGEATYAATKHGVLGYLTAVREELRGSGVQLSMIMPTVVDTELAAGTDTGAAAMLTPDKVAEAVADTIGSPRFEVSLPRYVSPAVRLATVLPQFIRDRLLRQMVPDQVAAVRDSSQRREYENRVTASDE